MDSAPTAATAPPEPFRVQVLDKMSQLMTAAFGFVAALAWNEAIKAAIDTYVSAADDLKAKLLYAVVVTLVAVVASLWIARTLGRLRTLRIPIPMRRRPA